MNTQKNNNKETRYKGLTKYEKKLELIKQRFARFIHFYGGYNITFNKFTFDTWNYEDELSRILHYHTNYKSFCKGQRFCKIIFEDTDIINPLSFYEI